MARLKLPGRSLEAPGNRGPRGMIITGATRDRTRLTACSAGFFGTTGHFRWRWFFFISYILTPTYKQLVKKQRRSEVILKCLPNFSMTE